MHTRLWVVICGLAFGALAGAQTAASTDAGAGMGSVRSRAQALLDSALSEKDLDLRYEALTAHGLAGTPTAKAELLRALTDPDGKLRFAAARGLAYLADPSTEKELAEAFRKENGWAVKKELAAAAAVLQARSMLPDLRTATLDPRPELAAAAAWALVDMKDPAGEAALVRLGRPARKSTFKEGSDRWARKVLSGKLEGDARLATLTLAQHGKREDVALLEQGLTSMDPRTRIWSAAGILRLTR